MLTHLHLAGYLSRAQAFVWGTCSDCKQQYPTDFTVEEVLRQKLGDLQVLFIVLHLFFSFVSNLTSMP